MNKTNYKTKGTSDLLRYAVAAQLLLIGSLVASEQAKDTAGGSTQGQEVPTHSTLIEKALSRNIAQQLTEEERWERGGKAVWQACQAVLDAHSDMLESADQRRVVQPGEMQKIIYVDDTGKAHIDGLLK